MTIVALDYLDWSVYIGGRHLTGHLIFKDRDRVELERPLSLREAKGLRPGHGERVYDDPYFRVTNKFDSLDQMVRAATKWCESNLMAPWILQEHSCSDLHRVLASAGVSETRVRILNLINIQWDRLDNPSRDGATTTAFYAAWKAWKP